MNKNMNIVVMTHNPKGDWGDVRPQIEKDGYYKGWNKSISVEIGQTILVYITADIGQIQYIMEVTNVEDKSIDLKLIRKLNENEMQQLSRVKLQENGLKQGTINYILNNNEQLYKYIKNVLNNESLKKQENKNMKTKNIMLYGAPGVGKTHNYKKLVSLIESGKYNESDIFESIIENQKLDIDIDKTFEIIKNEKRIEFVTFHQSYSYEDFIEGFRPNEEGKLELEDGIFKKISQNAEEQTNEVEKNQISYDEAYNTLRSRYIDNTNSDLKTVSGKNILISNFEDKFIQVKSEDGRNWFNVKKSDLEVVVNEILKQNIIKPSDIKLIDVKKDTIALAGYYFPIGNTLAEIIKESKVSTKEQKNFYIVIDEINRGNISKIFGELITLIEEDKRGKEEYKVKLPYSKKTFVVPSNLYIIATMNSTDKSIATIDIALRRRFTFLKMEPKKELVENEKAKALMNELNEHIKETIGKDYQLGHSYFMKIENENDLLFVKEYKIKPLLEEYFYGDETNYNKAIEILNRKDNE
ncbi:McrB family protein [Aliarcobacter butzleri]|uniref:McrB family protein n=1 Tax=Aliarcobacter butzleri TaxID=28197 RepID=UPI001EDD5960|nr:AAA family ATPase [Aliarcobacter butzleri]MCG3695139.1 AAA family ATPase [Aliarcobacter butzleri]MCT7585576.1 AAA family ATPase [Aliarcobacter butzleri]MDN5090812.1 AAA family ATPase [Aliarcobacter butzleri]